MSARFEIVRTDAAQPWHARFVVNDRITWQTENYTRQVGAERAVCSLVGHIGGDTWGLRWNGDSHTEKVILSDWGDVHDLTVAYIDERTS